VSQIMQSRPYEPEVYQPNLLETWIGIAQRQAAKDGVIIPDLARHFVPGRVLELGSGAGQLSEMLITLGWKVVASDYASFFVDYMRGKGLEAHRVDATDIDAAGLGRFENIFCQSITPFITHDFAVVQSAYASAFKSLVSGGRLVLIHGMEPRKDVPKAMRDHRRICNEAGFTDVRVFRNQMLPSKLYRAPMTPVAGIIERLLSKTLGQRFVVVASRA
jgi:SAM-dependent methyltransferase